MPIHLPNPERDGLGVEELVKQRCVIRTAVLAAVLLGSIPAMGQGLDDWVDACEVDDSHLLQLLENEVMLVGSYLLTFDPESNTYSLENRSYTTTTATGAAVCSTSRFYGQLQEADFPFRSAIQVGPDLVLTAWHDPFPGSDLSAVFGMRYNSSCNPPDWSHIPAANVFEVTAVVADGFDNSPPKDFLLLQLDREAADNYPRVRRSGQGRGVDASYPGDRLTLLSHPERLATKVDLNGRLVDYFGFDDGPRVTNLHSLIGSSGGMVYNRDERFIETVLRFGGGAQYDQDPDQVPYCEILIQDNGVAWTNSKIADFASAIPAFELLVTPLDTVVHVCVSGSCSNPTTTRTIEAPNPGTGSIDYVIEPPTGIEPELVLTVPALQGTLQAGQQFSAEETIDITGAACGVVYERIYTVRDDTHGFADVIRHIFDIQC